MHFKLLFVNQASVACYFFPTFNKTKNCVYVRNWPRPLNQKFARLTANLIVLECFTNVKEKNGKRNKCGDPKDPRETPHPS